MIPCRCLAVLLSLIPASLFSGEFKIPLANDPWRRNQERNVLRNFSVGLSTRGPVVSVEKLIRVDLPSKKAVQVLVVKPDGKTQINQTDNRSTTQVVKDILMNFEKWD